MTGYCRLCHLRMSSPGVGQVGLSAAERGRAEFVGLGLVVMDHMRRVHPGESAAVMDGLLQFQALAASFLVTEAPAAAASAGPVAVGSVGLAAVQSEIRAQFQTWLSVDEPIAINRVTPAVPGGAA